uniref:Major facilitator superfamily domain containing 6-like n=1 Tax=Lepisosteus oculatus TaxID=7918 RepID=W5N6Q5_LEPOC
MKKSRQWDVRRAVALASIFHFLHSYATACLIPFLTLYFRQLGLTASMTSIIMGTKYLVGLVWSPVSSFLAKYYNKRRTVILTSLLCSLGAGLILLLIPPSDTKAAGEYCNFTLLRSTDYAPPGTPSLAYKTLTPSTPKSHGITHTTHDSTRTDEAATALRLRLDTPSAANRASKDVAPTAQLGLQTEPKKVGSAKPIAEEGEDARQALGGVEPAARWSKDDEREQDKISGPAAAGRSPSRRRVRSAERTREEGKEEQGSKGFLGSLNVMDAQHQLFFLVLIAVGLWEALAAPLEWTVDDGLYEYLDFVDSTERYGKHRLWALLGAAFGVCSAGLLVSSLDCFIGAHTPRSAAHFYAYALATASALPVAVFLPMHSSGQREPSPRALRALQLVSADSRAVLCAVAAFVLGAAASTVDNFLFWQMQNRGSHELHMGVAAAVALLAEIALSFFRGKVLRVLGQTGTAVLGTVCLAFQCLYYSFLWSPWAVLPIQVLSAFSKGAIWWALDAQCDDISMPGMERSVQRVFRSVSTGLGGGLGSFASGFVAQRFSLEVLYRATAATLLLWSVGFLIIQSRIPRQKRLNYSRLLAADTSEVSDSDSDQERDWFVKAMKDDSLNNNH